MPATAWTGRTWWANNSNTQARSWRSSGWHVAAVDLAGRKVTFARGRVGGTHAEPAVTDTNREGLEEAPDAAPLEPAGEVLLTVAFQWLHAGAVTLDGPGKLVFPHGLRPVGGMYRLTLHPADAGGRPQVYIGESQDVCRRLTGNYRNPNPGQATSQRISDALRDHLRGGGRVSLDVAYAATVTAGSSPAAPLRLDWQAGRILAESAGVVQLQLEGEADLLNLDRSGRPAVPADPGAVPGTSEQSNA